MTKPPVDGSAVAIAWLKGEDGAPRRVRLDVLGIEAYSPRGAGFQVRVRDRSGGCPELPPHGPGRARTLPTRWCHRIVRVDFRPTAALGALCACPELPCVTFFIPAGEGWKHRGLRVKLLVPFPQNAVPWQPPPSPSAPPPPLSWRGCSCLTREAGSLDSLSRAAGEGDQAKPGGEGCSGAELA